MVEAKSALQLDMERRCIRLMPDYRVNMVVCHAQTDLEDEIEDRIRSLIKTAGLRCQDGPVVFQIYGGSL